MKKGVFAAAFLLVFALSGTEYFVSPAGSDKADGRSEKSAFKTVGKGMEVLKAGDTLTILPGKYYEAVKKVMAVISDNQFLNYAYNMCRSHHERWDGKGYPDKLMTTDIPFEARILAIVNGYDNFRTTNDGAEPLTHNEAINRIRFWSGTHFDPELVDAFLNIEKQIEAIRFERS